MNHQRIATKPCTLAEVALHDRHIALSMALDQLERLHEAAANICHLEDSPCFANDPCLRCLLKQAHDKALAMGHKEQR